MASEVIYLGYQIVTSVIQEAAEHKNVQELRAFLGLMNYYGRFISQLSTLVNFLNKIFIRVICGMIGFQILKSKLASAEVLAHYDP